MNLPEHHESPVVFVYLKGSVEMFFSLTEKETLEERNERMSSSWKRWEYSHFSSLWWRNNTTPDYGWSPGVEKRYILVVCDATVGSPDRMVHTGGNPVSEEWCHFLWQTASVASVKKRSHLGISQTKCLFAEEFEVPQTIYFTTWETKQNLESVFLYPVFVGDSRGFMIEFNSCFVLAQEKSIERTHWNNPSQTVCSESIALHSHCGATVTRSGLIVPYSIKECSGHHYHAVWFHISRLCQSYDLMEEGRFPSGSGAVTHSDLATCLRLSELLGLRMAQLWNSSRDSWILPSRRKISAEATD